MQSTFHPVIVGSHRSQIDKLSNLVSDELKVAEEGLLHTPLNHVELNHLMDGGLTDLAIYPMKGGPLCPSNPLLVN